MSNDLVEPSEDASDLLGRWLAHHDKAAEEGDAPPRRVPTAARLSETAAHRSTRPSASTALAELRSASAAPPVTSGVRRDLPGGEVANLDRPSPLGFEPVILRSVRKKAEPKDEPEKKDKRGRLSRLRSRGAAPDETPRVLEAPPPVQAASPLAAPVEKPRKLVPYDDMIALATTASLPTAKPEVEPVLPGPDTAPAPAPAPAPLAAEPDPQPQPAVEPVLPGPDTAPAPLAAEPDPQPQPAVEPVLPGPDTAPAPLAAEPDPQPQPAVEPVLPGPDTAPAPVAGTTKRRLLARTKRPEADEGQHRKKRPLVPRIASAPSAGTGTGGAVRGLLAAARVATPAHSLAPEARPAAKKAEPVPMLPAEPVVKAPEPSAPAMEMPAVYEFAPLKSSRRFLSLMLIAGLVASGYLGYTAYQSRDTMAIGIAGIVIVATLVIWAIRAGSTVTRLTVKMGQLEIRRQGGRMVFDLASTYTSIEVAGRPGSRKWRVVFLRRGMSPVVVDATMVDGRDFMRILRFFRPELA